MKNVVIIFILFLFLPFITYSQRVVKAGADRDTIVKTHEVREMVITTPNKRKVITQNITPRQGKWSIEGSFGMAFGDQTTINIVPQVRYSQSVYFSVGGGLSYSYYYLSHKGDKEKMNYMGLNLYARLTPFPYLAFQVQPEILERWGKQNDRKVSGRFVPTLLAGGGFIIPAGPGDIDILFLFDIIQNKYTPYGKNLYYTIGYSFPF